MQKIVKHLNFKYVARTRRSSLIDRQDIILWRQRYLQNIRGYRREGRLVYYQDETWVNEGNQSKTLLVLFLKSKYIVMCYCGEESI